MEQDKRILIIETSASECSVAVAQNGRCIAELSSGDSASAASSNSEHSRLLAPYIEQILEQCGAVDAVAVSYGPGSYTGLRIGLSTAKGVCFGANIPLLLIDSLRGLVCRAIELLNDEKLKENYLLCPMIDARRMEIYTALYNPSGEQMTEIQPMIVGEDSFKEIEKPLYIFGSGAAKCVEQLQKNGLEVHYIDGVGTSARYFAEAAFEAYNAEQFADVAYAEPLYLKEWQSTSVKN